MSASAFESALRARLDEVRRAWPNLGVGDDEFVAWVTERVPEDGEANRSLDDLRLDDLYLACACARGEARALDAFDKSCLGGLDAALAKLNVPADVAREVKQRLRARLFVKEGERAPKIADYAGWGDLRNWVRVAAVRDALELMRKRKKEVTSADELFAAMPASDTDPELGYIKQLYRGEFASAFKEAFSSLEPRQRNVLRQHFIHGLSIDRLGALYQVHRATAARWLGAAQEELFSALKRLLMRRLNVDRAECDSILRLLRSHRDITLEQLLKTEQKK